MLIPLSNTLSRLIQILLFVFLFLFLSSSQVTFANPDDLKETYEEIEANLFENDFGIPIYLESSEQKNTMRGDVYSIIYHPFNVVRKNLASLKNWCEIMPQHLNIKACTYQYINNQCKLTFYTGRKFYEKADDAYHLNYQFHVTELNDTYFNLSLNANEGPIDTKDYNINVEAIPLSENTTFFHLAYEYKYGIWTQLAMSTYFATLGYGKVGFTINDVDEKNNPIYVKGTRGVIERNSMRYYFAIQSFLNTPSTQIQNPFETRINNWFDLTEQYHKQLYEMEKKDYLKYKHEEREDQIRLQKALSDSQETANFNTACRITGETKKGL